MDKMKNYIWMIGAALAAFFMALLKTFHLGQKAEQRKQTRQDLEAAQRRLEVENEVNKQQTSSIRDALRKWMRKP